VGTGSREEGNWRDVMPEAPIPPVEIINQDPQFSAKEISRSEFESLWNEAHRLAAGRDDRPES
jgi:hypothetical protein